MVREIIFLKNINQRIISNKVKHFKQFRTIYINNRKYKINYFNYY